MNETTRRTLRTLLQTVVAFVIAGGLTEIVNAYADQFHVSGATRMLLAGALTIVVTFAQNYAEERGALRPILKAPPEPARRAA
jgi:uncharacterized membrane protein HdeD (DUF308 family)